MLSSDYEYGSEPNYSKTPTRVSTVEWNYTFKNWSPEVVSVIGAAEYVALYDSTKNSYEVTFVDYDGAEIQKNALDYGEIPVCSNNPVREATDEWNYEFIGWTPSIGKVTKVVSYTATYDSTKVKYEVVFMNGSIEYDAQEVEYGSAAEKPGDPKKSGYTFVGWNKDFSNVTGNMVVEALFEEIIASSSSKVPESSSSSVVSESSSSSVKGDDSSSSSKTDVIFASTAIPQFRATVAGRSVQIAGAIAGSAYAVLDMQGRVLATGRAASANLAVFSRFAGVAQMVNRISTIVENAGNSDGLCRVSYPVKDRVSLCC